MLIHRGLKQDSYEPYEEKGLRAVLIHRGLKQDILCNAYSECLRAVLIHRGLKQQSCDSGLLTV